MAAPQRLQPGRLTPAARPVDAFLRFDANPGPAQPIRPTLLGQPKGITTIQRGAQRSVQGVNPIEELTTALKPLSKLYDAGMEMYASDQYRRGQNEILKAADNISQATIADSLKYAAENREVDASNPMAGLLMDQTNPFRQAGRINQASQWVATMAKPLFRSYWVQNAGELQNVDPGNDRVTQVKAAATARLANAFGLDEFSPGFQRYVVPQINRQWEWFTNQQFEAFQIAQKSKGVEQMAGSIQGLLMQPGDVSDQQFVDLVNELSLQYGLAGEPIEVQRKAVLKAWNQLNIAARQGDNRDMARLAMRRLESMPSPITVETGGVTRTLTMSEWLGVELLDRSAEITSDIKTVNENDYEIRLRDSEENDKSINGIPGLWEQLRGLNPGDIGWETVIEALVLETDLPRNVVQKRAMEIRGENKEYQEAVFDPDPLLQLESNAYNQLGTDWDENRFRAEWARATRNVPQSLKSFYEQKQQSVIQAKRAEQASIIDMPTMNKAIDNQMQAVITREFPKSGPELLAWIEANPNADVIDYLAELPAARAAKIRDLYDKYGIEGRQLIVAEYTATKEPVPLWKQQEIWRNYFRKLNPVKPQQETQQQGESSSSSTQGSQDQKPQEIRTYYSPSQAVPEEFIKTNKAPYTSDDVGLLIASYAKSGRLNNNVKRTARMSGRTPGQYLLMLGDAYGLEIPAETRKKILKYDNRSQGFTNSVIGTAPGDGPLAQSTGISLNILTGRAPSYRRFTG